MRIDIQKTDTGEESIVIRYHEPNPVVDRIVGVLRNEGNVIWGRLDDVSVAVKTDEILYLESVEDKVFAYTLDKVVKLDGSLTTFMQRCDETFFRCSKSMVMNVNRVTALKSLSSNRIDACMEGGEHILISRRYASEFRRMLKGER